MIYFMRDLEEASAVLNSIAPPGERLAYLNPAEEALLKSLGGSGAEHVAGVPTYNWGQDLIDGIRGKSKRKAQQAAQKAAEEKSEAQVAEMNNQGWAADLISRGKLTMTDLTDPDKVAEALASLEGEYIDPFPEYARETGDLILEDLEGASGPRQTL